MFRMSFFTYLAVIASIYVVVTLLRKWRRAWAYRGLAHLPGPPREKWSKESYKGHIPNLYNPNTAFAFHDSLSKYGPVAKIYGIFGVRGVNLRLYINDPYAMGEVLLKEENGWERTESYTATGPASYQSTTQVVSGYMRLAAVIDSCFNCNFLAAYASRSISQAGIEREIKEQGTNAISVDIFGWAHRGALDAIGKPLEPDMLCVQGSFSIRGAFQAWEAWQGYQAPSVRVPHHRSHSVYSCTVRTWVSWVLSPALFSLAILRPIMPTLYKIGPAWFRRAIITRVPSKAIKQLLSIVDIQYEQALRIFSQRRAALTDSKHGHHNLSSAQKDVVTLIRDTLIFAGHDTTSGALACIFQMLAEHPEIQSKLREELLRCSDEDPDYVTLKSFPLLDAVIRETLRLKVISILVHHEILCFLSGRRWAWTQKAALARHSLCLRERWSWLAFGLPIGIQQPGVLTLTNGIHVDGLSRSRQEWPTPESQRPDYHCCLDDVPSGYKATTRPMFGAVLLIFDSCRGDRRSCRTEVCSIPWRSGRRMEGKFHRLGPFYGVDPYCNDWIKVWRYFEAFCSRSCVWTFFTWPFNNNYFTKGINKCHYSYHDIPGSSGSAGVDLYLCLVTRVITYRSRALEHAFPIWLPHEMNLDASTRTQC
ncbi:cytochrome P450 domain-containing protein [Rhizoctonia solani AG-1 IA]|uniref:Cytochrome P450 domain-containing protein n=1 Tax=Thanatephorus cucumeris (strain AG1-IA) TaxID=983506 RepID=L8X5V8_THACA|nr:cytochrome P450 domain-containing protein [Rhizoctonia solani AG-1 IA]